MSLRGLSPEDLLLVYCTMVPMEEDIIHKARKILKKYEDSLDWASITRSAAINKVPQLFHNLGILCAAKDCSISENMAKKLKVINYGLVARNMILLNELESILRAFEASGIRAMPIKGAALATVYAEPHLRTMDDIDLLVSNESGMLERAKLKMLELGFKQQGRMRYIKHDTIIVELLNEIRWPATTMAEYDKTDVRDATTIPYLKTDIWKRSFSIRVAGATVPNLSVEDSFLVLCAHSLFHCRINLRDLSDALVILGLAGDNFDWNYVITTARRSRLVVPLYCFLRLLDQLYEVKAVPEAIFKSLEKQRMIRFFKLILGQTWSPHAGNFTFILRLYKVFFFERERLGLMYSIKHYALIIQGVIRGYVSRGEGFRLLKDYLPRRLIAGLQFIKSTIYFGCRKI